MNISTLRISSINRLIAHQVVGKTRTGDAYAVCRDKLLEFQEDEKNILIRRLEDALANNVKTFQLQFEDKTSSSVYELLKTIELSKNEDYIDSSKQLTEKLADTHYRINIPGGYCLIGEGKTDKGAYFFFIIKAELQEAFNIDSGKLNLLKDVFLSPAKDFYKVGFFIKSGKNFIPFMYDDQFSMQKKDLTEYFYSNFLGLTTDDNDKLKSKNFFEDTMNFIEVNVQNLEDRLGLTKALRVLYREDASGIISAREFSDRYLEGDLKTKYEKKIVAEKYPISFTKNNALIDKRLQLDRITIPLSYNLVLTGSASKLNGVTIIAEPTQENMFILEEEINTGSVDKIIILKSAE